VAPDLTRAAPVPLLIPRAILGAMIAHCLREDPLECCGLLCGVPPEVASIYPLRNVLASETRYAADPRDLIAVDRELRAGEAQILAIYHSHPRWAAVPSRTDLEQNYYGDLPRIIVSLLGERPEVRAWRLDAVSYEELPWRLVADETGPRAVEPHAPGG
jgi:[CysO sulfur-carrier protein]-S-L-cysteine hydrolase